jgi:hypothetical protein
VGALFGLVLYSVYDLTNLAVLEKWTARMALADMALGLCPLRRHQRPHDVRGSVDAPMIFHDF